LTSYRGQYNKHKQQTIGTKMKLKTIGLLGIYGLTVALASAATCYVDDAPNQQDCGDAGTTQCTLVINGGDSGTSTTATGVCQDSPTKDALATASTGNYETTGVTCTCSCKALVGGVYKTASGNDNNNYSKLQSKSCPE
jgi:hypothetical protein